MLVAHAIARIDGRDGDCVGESASPRRSSLLRVHRACSGGALTLPPGSIGGARFLKTPGDMLAWVGVAVTVLASPAERGVTHSLSSDVLSPALVSHAPARTTAQRLEGWVSSLAVVRRGVGSAGTDSMRLFVAVAPVGRHSMGLQAIGSF